MRHEHGLETLGLVVYEWVASVTEGSRDRFPEEE
jgi:hypothetical protein